MLLIRSVNTYILTLVTKTQRQLKHTNCRKITIATATINTPSEPKSQIGATFTLVGFSRQTLRPNK